MHTFSNIQTFENTEFPTYIESFQIPILSLGRFGKERENNNSRQPGK